MAAYWFLFHQGNILLTDKGTIPLSKEIPFPNIEESNIFHLPDVEERSCYAATLETPITESCYKMIPLRASFEMLPQSYIEWLLSPMSFFIGMLTQIIVAHVEL